jgi:2,3-dihydro-2,3-dihydroxybenzoate dehydrogenase
MGCEFLFVAQGEVTMAFTDRVVVVTGAASGIGRATALGFSRQGARVALWDRNAAALAETQSRIDSADGTSQVCELDITNQSQVNQTLDQVARTWGQIDVLVNAAGISRAGSTSRGSVLEVTEADWDQILDVNLMGTVFCAQAAARHMMPQRRGRIVNVASIAGAIPRWHTAAYCVSKAGVRMFTKCLALELARYSITVNAVAPGPTDTPMLGNTSEEGGDPQLRERMIAGMPEIYRLGVPLGKLGQPEDVASAIQYLASDEAHHLTGVILNVDGMAQLS